LYPTSWSTYFDINGHANGDEKGFDGGVCPLWGKSTLKASLLMGTKLLDQERDSAKSQRTQ
jgi:hypothetical protein